MAGASCDCSHWKRGEKNVRSVFSLAKLAASLQVEITLVHDLASGAMNLDEAFYEWQESNSFKATLDKAAESPPAAVAAARQRVESFVQQLHEQAEFAVPPLYIPEVLRFFAFVTTQPTDMLDKLSRILRVRPGQYMIHYRKGDLKAPTRMGMTKDLARIVFEGERARFPELGELHPDLLEFEKTLFTAALLVPKAHLLAEMAKLDSRRNVVSELAALFWVPKSLVGFQLQDILRSGERATVRTSERGVNTGLASASA